MKKFTIFWKHGEYEIVKGNTVSDAFTKAGYGGGSIEAIDFYGEGDIRKNYTWNEKTKTWDQVSKMPDPGSKSYEDMVDFMRMDLESGMTYSKIIDQAQKNAESKGRDFYKDFEKWKADQQ
jgi:hypothetical protein